MLLYAIIMFLTGSVTLWLALAIRRGRTDLIHAYHQTKVRDHAAYGKAFGRAMTIIAAAMLLSGLTSLPGANDGMAFLSVGILFAGLTLGIVCLVIVQKKYNRGVF